MNCKIKELLINIGGVDIKVIAQLYKSKKFVLVQYLRKNRLFFASQIRTDTTNIGIDFINNFDILMAKDIYEIPEQIT
jgi:hypothetical protein